MLLRKESPQTKQKKSNADICIKTQENKCLFKLNTRSTTIRYKICSNLTIKMPECHDIVMVSSLLTLNISHTFL